MSGAALTRAALRDDAKVLRVDWLGEVSYRDGLQIQHEALQRVRAGGEDRLLLLEHPPVITLGRAAKRAHLLEDEQALLALGIEVIEVARGGDITYHGRGQLVGYLICDLRRAGKPDVHRFVRDLEAALIDALHGFGLRAQRVVGRTGVYLAPAPPRPRCKLASIGVGVRHWISHHGFALNVDTDLRAFAAIVPCGLDDIEMTSLAREAVGSGPGFALRVRRGVADAFVQRFGRVAALR